MLEALSSQDLWATLTSNASLAECPPTSGGNNNGGWGQQTDKLLSGLLGGGGNPFEDRGAISFDTSVISPTATVQTAQLTVTHVSVQGVELPVEVWGGVQPLFGATVDIGEFDVASELLATKSMTDILSAGQFQAFTSQSQINKSGLTQFLMRLQATCPYGDARWEYETPESAGAPPQLVINFLP